MGLMAELKEKRKEPQETEKKSGSLMAELQERKKYLSIDTNGVDDNYINTFISDANKFLGSAEEEYSKIGWGTASSAFDSRNNAWKDLNSRYDTVKAWLYKNRDKIGEESYKSINDALDSYHSGANSVVNTFKSAADFYSRFDTEDAYNTWNEFNNGIESDDFEQYSNAGLSVANPDWEDTFAPVNMFGWKPFGDGEDINNIVTFAEANANNALIASLESLRSGTSNPTAELVNLINMHMKDEEKAQYNYYIGKNDKQKADEYLEYITDILNQRAGDAIAKKAEESKISEVFFSAAAGLESFASGIGNLDNYIKGEEADATTAIQYAYEQTSGNNEGIFKVINDLGYTSANMLPSILVGSVTGGVGGALTMGASATGNAYAEMRSLGYEGWQAAGYASLVGASEGLLQKFLGGIGALGGKHSLSAATTKLVSGLDHALARIAIKVPLNMASEGLEEAIQTALEPAFKAMVTGEEYEAAEWSDILYSALLGALSAGILEGTFTVVGEAGRSINAKNAFGNPNATDSLINQGLEFSEGTEARAFAEKYNAKLKDGKSLNGTQLANLYEASESQYLVDDSAKLKNSILQKLGEYGETTDVTPVAEVLVKYAKGEKLSSKDIKILNNSDTGYKVMTGLNSFNIESGSLADKWAENIGTRRINPQVYNKGDYDASKILKGYHINGGDDEDDAVNKEISEAQKSLPNNVAVSESGKTIYNGEDVNINKIVSTDKGDVKVKLDNGKTVSTKDLSFSTHEEGLMYEMVARMEASPETANELINSFKPTNASQAAQYFTGAPLAYQYGKINYEEGLKNIPLSDKVKKLAFNRGKIDATTKAKTNRGVAKGKTTKKGGIIFEGDYKYNEASANELQKVSMAHIEVIDMMSNLETHVFESKVIKGKRVAYIDGKWVTAPNGYFKDGNKIYIDINAGNAAEGAMLHTMSHEIAHYIREWNAKGFKELGDFLISEYGKMGVSVTALIEKQKDKIKKRYKEEGKALPSDAKLFDMAYEELVADAMSEMLTDPKAYKKLAKLKQKNRTLWEKVGEAIKAILDKFKSALGIYKTEKPSVAKEAYFARGFSADAYNKLQDLYIRAFAEADTNYAKASATGVKGEANETRYSYEIAEEVQSKRNQVVEEIVSGEYKNVVYSERETLLEASENLENISDEEYLEAKEKAPFVLVMAHTPQIILDSMEGSKDRKVLIRRDALYLAIRESGVQKGHYHGLGAGVLSELPKYLEQPDVIIATSDNDSRRLVLTHIPTKNGQVILSVEFESLKDYEGKNDYFNMVITVFDLHENYLKGLFNKFNAAIKYEKEDLAQVNPQLYKWLRTINAKSSNESISQKEKIVNREFSEDDIHYSDRDSYSYETLTRKPDMKLTTVGGTIPSNRADIVALAKKNAASVGKTNKDGSVSVYVKDVDGDVILSRKGLLHGLDRRFQEIAPITVKAGEILQNSIKINELTPSKKEADSSYILIGAAQNSNGELCIVRSVVNKFSNELDTMDVLYAINAKKSTAVLNAPLVSTPNYRTTISISQLLDFVNSHFPDILPESVLRHYGYDARPEGKIGESALYSDRDSEGNTLTAEQQEFFKDSKVRWGGKLMPVYHGTREEFTVFDSTMAYDRHREGGLLWAAKDYEYAKDYSFSDNPIVMKGYLNATNILDIGDIDSYSDFDKRLREIADLVQLSPNDLVKMVNFRNAYIYDITSSKGFKDRLVELGYDGVETLEGGLQTFGFVNSNQFKSVDNKTPTSDPDIRYSERDPDAISDRTLLANALESVAKTDIEKNKLAQYKEKIALIESEQAKLADTKAKIKELSFAKGKRDTEAIKSLQFEANQTANRINTYDKQLLNLESTVALKNVLEREKALLRKRLEQKGKEALKKQKEKDAKTVRELMTRHTESRKKAIEGRHKTEMRHKIKSVVSDLNKLLLKPTKEQHVPIGLQKVVAEALDAINMDTMNAEERVAYYNDLISKSSNPDEIAMLKQKRDFFEYRDMSFKDKITALKNAYAEFKESDDPLTRNAHNEAVENLIKNTSDEVGNKSLKDMSLAQLEAVYDMYKAILATVRNSNKMFKEGRQATVTENSEAVKNEVKEVGGHNDRVKKSTKGIKAFTWSLMKPIYALQRIGSKTLTSLFDNVRAGEETYAVDINEAREFFTDKRKRYNYSAWEFKKRFDFKDSAGNSFSLSLEQIMSLYAYSKRDQADRHLEAGGFVFDDSIEVTEKNKFGIPVKYEVNDATPYRLRVEDLAVVVGTLTADQKTFVDEMQTYLSEVMGAKGNEVSLAMYDIKMFKEKHYFPLKTSKYFREFNPEQTANPMLRNSGFTKKTVPQAGNPIVLSNFMEVWTSHINDMSMYHSFVLPLEDFMRVYNYSSTAGGYDSVQQYIKNAYGAEANQYIERLMQDINGGVVSNNLPNGWLKMFGKFKKATVSASLSTIVQQPTAVIRAMALINPRYFVGIPLKEGHKKTWEEIKKYAPIAIIKEMGGIDVGSGRQAKEFITAQTYKGFGKVKGFFTDSSYRDSIFMWGATKADELGWNSIWKAVKREVASKQNLKAGTEEFFKACGTRFTEVVTQTQVYDSVFARSGIMRDKGDLNKFATSFMGEPTTSFNMIYNAILSAKRGGSKAQAAKTISSVYVSIVGAAAMASLVYALRDDDEDESYLEKWAGAFGNKLSSEVWIHNMIPYIRDIASIWEGWDVERPDMSIIADIKSSFDKLFKTNEEGELEWNIDFSDFNSVYSAIESFGGSIAAAFGLPLKNLMRDTRGIFNGFKAMSDDIETGNLGGAFIEGFTGKESGKSDKLYNAIINGDGARLEIYKKGYKTEQAYETAVRTALRENDSRIHEAAQAKYDGDLSEYTRIVKAIIAEGNFSQDIVVGAVNTAYSAIRKGESVEEEPAEDKDEVESIYSTSDLNSAFDNGDTSTALKIIDDLVNTKVANGKTEKEAKSSLRSSMTSYWKPLYKEAYQARDNSEMARIRQILYSSGLYGTANDVVKTAQNWLKD